MKVIRENIFVILVFLISLFLRLYKLGSFMQFIPDQGWFYLSARDMILTHIVPLVGPPTSHPWIHHGPLWTYTLALLLLLSRFNPVGPAYFIAFLGSATVVLFYKTTLKMFSKNIASVATLLFATSPLVVMNSRIPYHTSPIPFFAILLFLSTYLWVKGNVKIFPLITFLLGVLYNHEITTFVYVICISIILVYGIVKHRKWATNLKSFNIILLSVFSLLVPMIPFLLYDMNHNFPQTVGFFIWVIFRILKLPLGIFIPSLSSSGSNPSTIPEFFSYYQQLAFVQNFWISVIIFIASVVFFLYTYFLKNRKDTSSTLLLLFFTISLVGLFTHRVPIEADTLLVSPFFILFIAILLDYFIYFKFWRLIMYFLLGIVVVINVYTTIHTDFFTHSSTFDRTPYFKYSNASDKVIELASGRAYNIKGKGELSSFPVFLMPYEYILWWKGQPVSKSKEKTTIEIWEKNKDISVSLLK